MLINPYNVSTLKPEGDSVPKNVSKEIALKIIEDSKINLSKVSEEILKQDIEKILTENYGACDSKTLIEIQKNILNDILGYGILQKYIDDKSVTDIRVVSYDKVYIKKYGEWIKTNCSFESPEDFEEYIRFCAIKNNNVVNYEKPIAIFSDRKNLLRLEVGINPVNVNSANLVIRIHRENTNTKLEEIYTKTQMLSKKQYLFLKFIASTKSNIVICGKGGSGKTTLLRAIISDLPNNISITTNEETAELYIEGNNVIQRECLNNNGRESVDLEELVRHCLVMSNDAIIVGELKGKEASVFFDAVSTGHIGMATVHASSAQNCVDRIITLIKKDIKAQYYTEDFLRRFLCQNLNYIIYMEEFTVKKIVGLEFEESTGKIIYMEKGDEYSCV